MASYDGYSFLAAYHCLLYMYLLCSDMVNKLLSLTIFRTVVVSVNSVNSVNDVDLESDRIHSPILTLNLIFDRD